MLYSTYLGGNTEDYAYAIAVDKDHNAYVTGSTKDGFPTTTGVYQTKYGGSNDAFVTKLNPDGTALIYSTYLGNQDVNEGEAIGIDGQGDAYVAGLTQGNFPVTAGAYQTSGGDIFLSKINPQGNGLLYSTYLGGNIGDAVNALSIDNNGNAYLTGNTQGNFPTSVGAYQSNFQSECPGLSCRNPTVSEFIVKINATGTAVIYSTYLSNTDHFSYEGRGIGVDSQGNVYVTGQTTDNFPTTPNALQPNFGGGAYEAFVSELNASGSGLVYSSYLGGNREDTGYGIALDSRGLIYVVADTGCNFPVTSGAYQTVPTSGGGGTFIVKIDLH